MSHLRRMLLLTTSLTLAACGATFPPRTLANEELRVKAIDGNCPVTKFAPPESVLGAIGIGILADVAGTLIGNVIDSVGEFLSQDKVTSFTATTRVDGFFNKVAADKPDSLLSGHCFVVAIGEFGAKNAIEVSKLFPNTNVPTSASADLFKDGLTLSKPPSFYMEGVLVPSTDRAALAFDPKFLRFGAFLGKNNLRSTRDLSVRIEWSTVAGNQPFGAATLEWKGLQPASSDGAVLTLSARELDFHGSPWFGVPSFASKPGGEGAFGPVNVKVLVAETSKPGAIAKAFGEALKKKKSEIGSEISNQVTLALSEQRRLESELSLNKAATDAFDKYIKAYDEAKSAEAAFTSEVDAAKRVDKRNVAVLAYAKVQVLEVQVRSAFDAAGMTFAARPALPPIP